MNFWKFPICKVSKVLTYLDFGLDTVNVSDSFSLVSYFTFQPFLSTRKLRTLRTLISAFILSLSPP
jgi:hypothetical protein